MAIMDSLRSNRSLCSVNLTCKCRIKNRWMKTSLSRRGLCLDNADNEIGPEGGVAVRDTLRSNNCLQSLNLSSECGVNVEVMGSGYEIATI